MGLQGPAMVHGVMLITLIVFLPSNFGKRKMFLGDGGAKFIGFIQIVSAIDLLAQIPHPTGFQAGHFLLMGIFILPVLDVVRVAMHRWSRGNSPFSADRKHLHHLVIGMGYSHMRSTTLLAFTHVALIAGFTALATQVNLIFAAIGVFLLFIAIIQLLKVNKGLLKWQREIHKMENIST
jgi:UDP-GlcNAc:undecaprenyl-phosphate/decaprenyl-phosphate GlcNAc-1-phosphate transferase